MARHRSLFGIGLDERGGDPVAGGADHLHVDTKLAAVGDVEARMLSRIGIQHRRNIVFGVAGGEQHAGHRQNTLDAARRQFIKPLADDRLGEFEKAVFDLALGETRAHRFGHTCKFAYRVFVAAAVTAHHDAEIFAHNSLSAPVLVNRPWRSPSAKAGS